MMIAIDDVHWSDATSLRWLACLVRRLEDLAILGPAGPQATLVRAGQGTSAGDPLSTLQLLDAPRAAGPRPADADAGAAADLAPERVSQFVLDRLRRLSPDAIRVADQVAVLGTHADVRHVRALSMLAEHQLLVAG